MFSFMIKKNFNLGKNLLVYFLIDGISYDILKEEWVINCLYFYNKKMANFYKICHKLHRWIKENPTKINEKNWTYI